MRKAAGTSVRQYFLKAYQSLSCLPPEERNLVDSEQPNWRCHQLAFYHVEWHCFVGSEIVRLRKASSGSIKFSEGRISEPLQIFSLGHFNSPRFITCLRHPVDRFISISWYGSSSHGVLFTKNLMKRGKLGGMNRMKMNSAEMHDAIRKTKTMVSTNSSIWNSWIHRVDQSTVWNYYVARLTSGRCTAIDHNCRIALGCLAQGNPRGAMSENEWTILDDAAFTPHNCDVLFNDSFVRKVPKAVESSAHEHDEVAQVSDEIDEIEQPKFALWVAKSLSQACERRSYVKPKHRTESDLEDAKVTLTLFDLVLISEKLSDSRTSKEREFDSNERWLKNIPKESIELFLQKNSLDVTLYWFADELFEKRLKAFD